jgi:hypothetical protein
LFEVVWGDAALGSATGRRRNQTETIPKPDRPELCEISVRPKIKREMTMIQIGSKEEIALLLALFGTHTQPVQPVKTPKRRRA